MLSINEWSLMFALALAQAHLTRLLLQASLLDSLRQWAQNKHPLLRNLLSCQMCVGFWVALVATSPAWRSPYIWATYTLVVSFIGFLLYQLVEKYAPCPNCTSQSDLGGWQEMA
jgi:thiosulfate reductase cytochrome b subunit